MTSSRRRWLVTALKTGLLALIIAWLVDRLRRADGLELLSSASAHWPLLLLAWAIFLGTTMLSFVRWFVLVRALDLPFRLADAVRLGLLGMLFSVASFGSVGGDVVRGVLLARETHERRTAAVATIVVDRILGLFALMLFASGAVAAVDRSSLDAAAGALAVPTWAATGALGLLLAATMLLPERGRGPTPAILRRLPRVAAALDQLRAAARRYRARKGLLAGCLAGTLGLHALDCVGFFLLSQALAAGGPSLASHFFIVPLGMLTASLPLTPAGIGPFEAVMDLLYEWAGPSGASGRGLLVVLAFRVLSLAIASLGTVFLFVGGRGVRAVVDDAKRAGAASSTPRD